MALMSKLASQVDPEFKPFARRGERTSAAGTVDAIVGFNKISALAGMSEMDIYNRTRDVFHHYKLPYDAEPREE